MIWDKDSAVDLCCHLAAGVAETTDRRLPRFSMASLDSTGSAFATFLEGAAMEASEFMAGQPTSLPRAPSLTAPRAQRHSILNPNLHANDLP